MSDLPPPRFVDTAEELTAWIDLCAKSRLIAVDTESDSFHHYREKVCLIQMTANGDDAIIDPLALSSLEPLGRLLADPAHTKIFHDACYDLICLRRDYGFTVHGLFDTMLASRLLGRTDFGLAAILRERFGHEADKALQRSDWTRRPLTPEQVSYARYDTHFLPALTRLLTEELREAGRLEWAREEFERLPELAARVMPRSTGGDPDGFWRIRGIRGLPPAVLGRIRALYLARERIAERLDRPPFKVFGDKVLVELAHAPPRSLKDLRPRPGLRRAGIDRFGRELVEALGEARSVHGRPPPGVKPRRRSGRLLDPRARERYEQLRGLRRDKASELGLDPEVLLGNAVLEDLARIEVTRPEQVGAVPELQGWRAPLLNDALFELLRRAGEAGGHDSPAPRARGGNRA